MSSPGLEHDLPALCFIIIMALEGYNRHQDAPAHQGEEGMSGSLLAFFSLLGPS